MRLFTEEDPMSDLQRYITKRKETDADFADNYNEGY